MAWSTDDFGGQRGSFARPQRRARSPFAHYSGTADPVRDLVLLRRRIEAFRQRPSGLWAPGAPKEGPKRALDDFLLSKRSHVVLDVVAVGPDARDVRPGQRVVMRTNESVACPGCGLPADRRIPLDAGRRYACRRCGTRWQRDEGIMLGDCGWNPISDGDGPRFARASSYEIFVHEDQVAAVLAGGGDVINESQEVVPLHDRVLVRRVAEQSVSKGGIVIPDNAKEKPSEGEVVAVGPGRRREDGSVEPVAVAVGSLVLFGKYAGMEVKIGEVDHVIFREEDILAVVRPRPAAAE